MRLPFSWNNPDEAKLAKGRQRRNTRIVEWHPERVYALEEMPRLDAHPKAARGINRTAGRASEKYWEGSRASLP
jgi:hypothetical protein